MRPGRDHFDTGHEAAVGALVADWVAARCVEAGD
jgi:hypothetical protein